MKLLRIAAVVAIAMGFAILVAKPASATTITKPGKPVAPYALGLNTAIRVTWKAPPSDGGSPITGYTVTFTPGPKYCRTKGNRNCTLAGLNNGTKYIITVQASNVKGLGKSPFPVQATPNTKPDCGYVGRYANLQGCSPSSDVTHLNLTDANLTGANLGDVLLTDANLTNADLLDATFDGTVSGGIVGSPIGLPPTSGIVDGYLVAPEVELFGAQLAHADLNGFDLERASFMYANLDGVEASSTDLENALLAYADLSQATLTDANLQSANVSNANLSDANLSDANLGGIVSGELTGTPTALPVNWSIVDGYLIGPGAGLNSADLSGIDLSGADLSGTFLNDAELSGTNLNDADLSGAELSGTNLNGAELNSADLAYADLESADLESADLDSADLAYAVLFDANLTGATLVDADLTYLNPLNLTTATWSNTTCPDGSNSDNDGNTCVNNLIFPGAPTAVSAVPGDGQATVSWTPPDNEDSADVTSYTATVSDVTNPGTDGDGNTCTYVIPDGSPETDTCTATGLTDGDSYTFTVTASNENGVNGPASAPSSAVTPTP